MNFTTPPLPYQWPYLPRMTSESCKHYASIELPGLTGLWNLEAFSSLIFSEPEKQSKLPFGRGGTIRSGQLVLRPYKRGGLIRYINTNIYHGTTRFQQEFCVHNAIWKSGLPTVKPIGWAFKSNKFGNEGVFLTKFADGIPWPQTWNKSEEFLQELTTMLKALCSWGLYSPDLNATNILVTPDKGLVALDWDKARWSRSSDLMTYYRERLIRSMKKLGAKTDVVLKVQNYIKNN